LGQYRSKIPIQKSGEVDIIHLIRPRDRINRWRRSKKGSLFGLSTAG
jgi:hypothetical protein